MRNILLALSIVIMLPALASASESVVYMTRKITKITPQALIDVFTALNVRPRGKIAVKISTGEPGSNYLRPELIGDFVRSLGDASIVECNTIYGRSRLSTRMHMQVAEDHGFTKIAPVDIMDAEGSIALPVKGGKNMRENYVGSHFRNYDWFVVLSHFKGHTMAGFGGAVKNASIGIASARGKGVIHGSNFIEAMAEAAKSVSDSLKGHVVYINVMNRLSLDCDCESDPREPDMHDIGILASTDPIALDKACVDLIYSAKDGASFVRQIERLKGVHTLEHAEKIGFGSCSYRLINID